MVAILLKEPDHDALIEKLIATSQVGIGTPSMVEAGIVLSARLGQDAQGMLARFLREAAIAQIPFGDVHYGVAVDAWLRFGKGRHPAGLNLGDCLAYATARLANRPLLCVGDDFSRTDLELA